MKVSCIPAILSFAAWTYAALGIRTIEKEKVYEKLLANASDTAELSFTVLLFGLMNLFSKNEDKVKQEELYEEVTYKEMSGVIIYGNDSCRFFSSEESKSKHADKWLIILDDTLRMVPAQLYRKTKNGIIKNRRNSNEGWQLMKGDTCVAAFDKNEQPMALYLRKEISRKDRLIIAAFFVIRSLEKLV